MSPATTNDRDRYLWYGRVLAVLGCMGWPPMSLHLAVYNVVQFGVDRLRPVAFKVVMAPAYAESVRDYNIGCIVMCQVRTLVNLPSASNPIDLVPTLLAVVVVSLLWAGACGYYARANDRNPRVWAIAGCIFLWWAVVVMALMNRFRGEGPSQLHQRERCLRQHGTESGEAS